MVGIEDCENEDRRMMNLGLLRREEPHAKLILT